MVTTCDKKDRLEQEWHWQRTRSQCWHATCVTCRTSVQHTSHFSFLAKTQVRLLFLGIKGLVQFNFAELCVKNICKHTKMRLKKIICQILLICRHRSKTTWLCIKPLCLPTDTVKQAEKITPGLAQLAEECANKARRLLNGRMTAHS